MLTDPRSKLHWEVRVMGAELTIEVMSADDWLEVRHIYQDGIATNNATFETEAPDWEAWDRAHLAQPRLVARLGNTMAGWSALTPASPRVVYAGVADVSIYIGEQFRGRGIGRALLSAMIERSEKAGIWTLQAGVFPENEASMALHRACGFRTVGVRERIGRMNGVWRDVVLLERRSGLVR